LELQLPSSERFVVQQFHVIQYQETGIGNQGSDSGNEKN